MKWKNVHPLYVYNLCTMTAFSSTENKVYKVRQSLKKKWQLTSVELEMEWT